MMNVQELADAVDQLRARTTEITGQVKDATERLAVLQAAIPESIAMGDAAQTRELRGERENLEAILRDHEVAERVLSRKLETALQQLAVEQLPEVLRAAEVARDELEVTAERILGEVKQYLDARRVFLTTRNRAYQGNGRPSGDVQPQTPLAGAVVRLCRDGFGAV